MKFGENLSLEQRAEVVVTTIRIGLEKMKDKGAPKCYVWLYLGKYLGKLETLHSLGLVDDVVYAEIHAEIEKKF